MYIHSPLLSISTLSVQKVLSDIRDSGLRADSTTHLTMLSCFARAAGINRAQIVGILEAGEEHWKWVCANLFPDGVLPQSAVNNYLRMYASAQRVARARDVWQRYGEMTGGAKPDAHALGTMIRMYASTRRMSDAEALLAEVRARADLEVHEAMLRHMINGFARIKQLDKSMQLLRELSANPDWMPSKNAVATLVWEARRQGDTTLLGQIDLLCRPDTQYRHGAKGARRAERSVREDQQNDAARLPPRVPMGQHQRQTQCQCQRQCQHRRRRQAPAALWCLTYCRRGLRL